MTGYRNRLSWHRADTSILWVGLKTIAKRLRRFLMRLVNDLTARGSTQFHLLIRRALAIIGRQVANTLTVFVSKFETDFAHSNSTVHKSPRLNGPTMRLQKEKVLTLCLR